MSVLAAPSRPYLPSFHNDESVTQPHPQPHSSIVCLENRAMRPRWHPAGNAHGQNERSHADLRQYVRITANHVQVCAHTIIQAETASFPAAHISFFHMNYRDMRPTLAGSAGDTDRCRRIHAQAPFCAGYAPRPPSSSPFTTNAGRAPNRMRAPAFGIRRRITWTGAWRQSSRSRR